MVLLMRFDAAALSAAEKATAPDGVVAYSAVCTQAHPLTDRRRGSDGSRAGEAWEVTFKDGRPQQNNFDGFVVARIDDAPINVRTHIVPAGWDVPSSGVGEPGLPPVAQALCNAIFAATGQAHTQPTDRRPVEGVKA